MQGNAVRAEALEQVALALWREVGHYLSTLPRLNLAYLALQRGDVAQARVLLAESFPIEREQQLWRWWIPWWLAAFASLAATQDQAERAARLFGAAEALGGASPVPAHRRESARHVATVRAQLDEGAFAAAWAAGQAMTLEQAVAEALDDAD